jgi:hypothetical protein
MSQHLDSDSDSYYDGDDWRFVDGNIGEESFENEDVDIIFDGEREVLAASMHIPSRVR